MGSPVLHYKAAKNRGTPNDVVVWWMTSEAAADPYDRNSRLIVEWRTGELPMAKKTKTKTQKAEEDANLDDALNEFFPG